jgi:uncharacterized protein (TIGR02145 family)
MKSHSSPVRALVAFTSLVAIGLLSCDRREEAGTAPGATTSLVPRLVLADGDTVPAVDSVRIVLDLDGQTGHFFDRTVDYKLKGLAIPDVPVGARWNLKAQGIHVASDSIHRSIWWEGSQTGTAQASNETVPWTRVQVAVGDTTAPTLDGTGLPSLPSVSLAEGTTSDSLTLILPKGDSLYIDGVPRTANTSTSTTEIYVVAFAVPKTLRVKVVSPAGNVTTASYSFQAAVPVPRDSTLSALSTTPGTFDAPYSKSKTLYVDSVPSGTTQVVVNATASVSGDVAQILYNGATGNVLALSQDTATCVVQVVNLNGKSGYDTILLRRSALAPAQARDSTLASLSTTPGTFQSAYSKSRTLYVDSVPFGTSQVVVNATPSVPGDVSSILYNGSTSNVVTLRGDADSILVEIVNLNGRSLVDTIRIRRSQIKPGTARDSTLASLSVDSGVLDPAYSPSHGEYDDTVPTWFQGAVVRAIPKVPGDVALVTFNGSPNDSIALRSTDPTSVEIKVFNLNGNTASTTLRIWHRPDLVPPRVSISSPSDGSTVPYSTDRILVLASATDDIGVDSTAIGSEVCKAVSCSTIVDLKVGPNKITARAWDHARNTDSASITITRGGDVTPPTIVRNSGTSDKSVLYATTTATVSWTVTDDVKMGSVTIDGIPVVGSADVYSSTISLVAGANKVKIVALDSAGHSTTDSITITRGGDVTPPTVTRGTGTSDQAVLYATKAVTVSWTVADDVKLGAVTINGNAMTGTAGVYAASIPLVVGSNGIKIVALDSAGHSTTDSITITRGGDVTPPTVTRGTGTSDQAVLYATKFDTVSWTVADDVRLGAVTINGSAVTGVAGVYSAIVPLSVGANKVKIAALDSANNQSVDSITITRGGDVTPPTIVRNSGTSDRSVLYATSTAVVSWTVTDDVKMGTVTINGIVVTGSAGVYSATVPLAVGANKVRILALDSASNQSKDSVTVTRGGDVTAPVIAHVANLSVPYTTSSYTASWSVSDDVKMGLVTINGVAATSSAGVYSAVVALRVGNDTIRIVANDSAGNVSKDSVIVTRNYITFTDSRDGRTYNAIQLGTQVWMAQNLNYGGTSSTPVGVCAGADGSTVPGDATACDTYGRIYTWDESVNGSAASSASPSGVQGVCPVGWHVPSDAEWTTFISNVEADPRVGTGNATTALRSTYGWQYGNGSDLFGFRVISAPMRSGGNMQFSWSEGANFWTTTQTGGYGSDIEFYINTVSHSSFYTGVGLSMRCVQN